MNTGGAFIEVASSTGTSCVTSLRSASPLRLLAPVARGRSVWVYTSSYGGGVVAGDRTRLAVKVDAGARCFLGSQSVGKIYRNPESRPSDHETVAEVGAGGLLAFLPDPIQPFAESRFVQRQRFDLAEGANLVLLDAVTAGRAARDERWALRRFESRNEIRRNGVRRFLDALVLDAEDGPLRGAFRMGRFQLLASLVVTGPMVSALRTELELAVADAGISRAGRMALSGGPFAASEGWVLRLVAERPEDGLTWIRHRLRSSSPLLGDDPWARKW